MMNLNKKLLTLYLALGILFFVAVLYLFAKNEVFSEISSNLSHKVRLTSARIIKNNFFKLQVEENNYRNTEEDEAMAYNSVQKKWQSYFLFVNETDMATYAKSTPFNITFFESPFSVDFQNDALLPVTALKDTYRLDLEDDGKKIAEFDVPNLNTLFEINKKSDTVTAEKTIKLISKDKRIILFLIFTID